jgi:regulator of nucleoside diphosphate kinase
MSIAENNLLIISDLDYQRLLPLVEKYNTPAAEMLDDELGRAEIVPEADIPDDVVSMNSSVI